MPTTTTTEPVVALWFRVPAELRNRVKAQAAARGLTLAEWLAQAAAMWEIHNAGPWKTAPKHEE